MPLSFLTRRGSKKAAQKSAHSRDGSAALESTPISTPQNERQDMPRTQAGQSNSTRRRGTTSGIEGEDVFLNLANDSPAKAKLNTSQRSRSKSIPEPEKTARLPDTPENNSTLKYFQSLSQRAGVTRSSDKRRSINDPKQLIRDSERASTVSSRAPTLRPSARESPDMTDPSKRRKSGEYHKTPSPERSGLRKAEFAYSTPEPFEVPKTAPTESGRTSRGQMFRDGLDSEVASTAAASAVWDELVELKSRMRKLETGGSRTREAYERPRTAATHTTNSASRRSSNNDHLSPTWLRPSSSSQEASEAQPLLQSALRKARLVVERDVYTALESSASDALQLATTARTDYSSDAQSSATSALSDYPPQSQRQLARKADNLCRSLTELCIVLCERQQPRSPEHPTSATHRRPPSSDLPNGMSQTNGDSPLAYLDSRRKLADRMERLQNRHNARAGDSLPSRSPNGRHSSVTEHSSGAPWTTKSLNRAATTNAHFNTRGTYDAPDDPADLVDEDSEEEDLDKTATIRGPPRAMTELAQRKAGFSSTHGQSHSPRDLRLSKEITSRNPLPEGLSPTIRKALESRNTSTYSVRSDRTARVPNGTTNGVRSPTTARSPESGYPNGDDIPLSPTSNSINGASRRSFASTSPERASIDERVGSSGKDQREKDREKSRRGSASGRTRLPPSTGAGLAERLEAKRQQRVTSDATPSSRLR